MLDFTATQSSSFYNQTGPVIQAIDYGVVADGTTNNTSAIANAVAAAVAAGSALMLPQGTIIGNWTLTGPGVIIFGAGGLPAGGTILKPYDYSIPCVAIGNGVLTTTAQWQLRDMRIEGNGAGATSDGIKINGSQQSCYISNVWVTGFGRYNIHLTSTPTAPTSYVWFDGIVSNNGAGSCFYADYGSNPAGGSYTTALALTRSSIQPLAVLSGTDTAMTLSGVVLWVSDSWIECGAANHGTRGGYVYLTQQSGAPGVGLYGSNVTIDTSTSSNHCFFVNETPSPKRPSAYVVGSISSQGRLKWLDGNYTSLADTHTRLGTGKTIMTEPVVSYRLGFGDISASPEDVSDLMLVYRTNSGAGDFLTFTGGPVRVPGSLSEPLQMQAGGAMWRDSDAMLRFTSTTYTPAADSDGWLVGMKVGVPASAAASGKIGQWAADTSYVYICVAANTWMRAAIATW